jgi:hypothetical protein
MANAQSIGGKLRIGDDWNAISIIALAQSNPLKAIAEFVENSIDAGARRVTIVRGREQGESFISITDDGEGVRRNDDGIPDFRYVATHICDSFKRHLTREDASGIQGEFGIGLLSFWTLGESLYMTSSGTDGRNYQMRMDRSDQRYRVLKIRSLVPLEGTELKVKPLLPGIGKLSGEKLEWYLASELRDRIRTSGVDIRVIDRRARKEFRVAPRQFDGELIRDLPVLHTPLGEIYLELYFSEQDAGAVGIYRSGTRVLDRFDTLDEFAGSAWVSRELEGIVDAPFLQLTPGTRSGIVRDHTYRVFLDALDPVTGTLQNMLDARRRAEEVRASEKMLKSIQRAFREALLALPVEDYDWFDVSHSTSRQVSESGDSGVAPAVLEAENGEGVELPNHPASVEVQTDFFQFPGPLHSVRISPMSSVLAIGQSRTLRAVCRDRSRRTVTDDLAFHWLVIEGGAVFADDNSEFASVIAPDQPGLVRVRVTVTQGDDIRCEAAAQITVTDELPVSQDRRNISGKGLPGYTFEHAPGTLWRSRFDTDRNLIVVNNGHRDFVFASGSRAMQLRYIGRLYAKELVQKNFAGAAPNDLLERMLELILYVEEGLR